MISHRERLALAASFADLRQPVAEAVTDEFFRRHPDWVDRYGKPGRARAIEDAQYHLDFLSSALIAGEPQAFADYVRWARRVLEARGIGVRFLRENLVQIGETLTSRLGPGKPAVEGVVHAGLLACDEPPGLAPPPQAEGELAPERRLYLQAILHGQRSAAAGIVLEAHHAGRPVLDLYLKILQPAQYEVGRLWESNAISVAEEHMATAITQSVMARLYPLLPRQVPADSRPSSWRSAREDTTLGVAAAAHRCQPFRKAPP
jgi:hypothetical protein